MAGGYHSVFRGSGIEFDEVREDADGDDVSLRYAWSVNGEVVSSSETLEGGWFDKGDTVSLAVTPSDGDAEGERDRDGHDDRDHGSPRHQQRHHGAVPVLRSNAQRGGTRLQRCVDGGALVQEQGSHVSVPVSRSYHQRRPPVVVRCIDSCASI